MKFWFNNFVVGIYDFFLFLRKPELCFQKKVEQQRKSVKNFLKRILDYCAMKVK